MNIAFAFCPKLARTKVSTVPKHLNGFCCFLIRRILKMSDFSSKKCQLLVKFVNGCDFSDRENTLKLQTIMYSYSSNARIWFLKDLKLKFSRSRWSKDRKTWRTQHQIVVSVCCSKLAQMSGKYDQDVWKVPRVVVIWTNKVGLSYMGFMVL